MLKTIYDNEEDIPEGYKDLYTERNGKWELTGVQGVKTQADVDRVQQALVKERNDHKATKEALKPFEGLDAEAVLAQQHELEEAKAQLEAIKKDGSIDETKLGPVIDARVAQKVAPIEREKNTLARQLEASKAQIAERENENLSLKSSIRTGNIQRAIRDEAAVSKMLPTAIGDAVLKGGMVFEEDEQGRVITKDGVAGVTPGLSPKEWLKDEQERSPHWWPASVGGGSKGATGGGSKSNPWSAGEWNLTKQGAYVREHGEEKARQMAESVGSSLGATKPPKAA